MTLTKSSNKSIFLPFNFNLFCIYSSETHVTTLMSAGCIHGFLVNTDFPVILYFLSDWGFNIEQYT